MITGLAHIAVCVPDVDAAVRWYETVLGLRVLSPPYRSAHAGDATWSGLTHVGLTQTGLTHVGLVCDDVEATRRELEAHDVEFLTTGIADVAGLRTTWFRDPWGVVFILVEKRHEDRPYWRQHRA